MLFKFNSSNIKYNTDFIWKLFMSFCMVFIILSSSNQVFADATSTSDPFGDQLCNVVGILQGNVAKAVASVGIFVAAIGFLSGKMQWQTVAVLAVGIITIFSAGAVITFLSGGNSSATTCGSQTT
jgi:type IV secretory pathway VirB2 component (pilin)